MMLKYIKSYNSLLDENKKDFQLTEDYDNISFEIFLVNENNDKNQLNSILNNFIKYQNDFILNISDKYFKKKNIEEINVQEANEQNIPKFCSSNNEFLAILMNNSIIKICGNNDIKFNFGFDLDGIESDLAEKIIPGLKKFRIGLIRTMKNLNVSNIDDIIYEFRKKFIINDLTQNQQDYLNKFIKNFDKKQSDEFLLSIEKLMSYTISNNENNSETDLETVIEKIS